MVEIERIELYLQFPCKRNQLPIAYPQFWSSIKLDDTVTSLYSIVREHLTIKKENIDLKCCFNFYKFLYRSLRRKSSMKKFESLLSVDIVNIMNSLR